MEGNGNEALSAMETLLAGIETEQSEGKAGGDKPEGDAAAGTQEEKEGTEGEAEDAGDAGDEDKPVGDEPGDKPENEDEGEDKPEKPKRPSGSERLKRRLAAAEAENAELRRGAPRSGEVTREAIIAEIGNPPQEADYKGDFLAFERALTAYELDARQAVRELRKAGERAQTARSEAMREAADDHMERIEEFRAKVKDFDDTLKSAANLKASPTVESLVVESDKSAHLVYHLAKNPAVLEKLNRMDERSAAREIGRIEATLSLPKPKVETRAPKPVVPPKGGASPKSPDQEINSYLRKTYGEKHA